MASHQNQSEATASITGALSQLIENADSMPVPLSPTQATAPVDSPDQHGSGALRRSPSARIASVSRMRKQTAQNRSASAAATADTSAGPPTVHTPLDASLGASLASGITMDPLASLGAPLGAPLASGATAMSNESLESLPADSDEVAGWIGSRVNEGDAAPSSSVKGESSSRRRPLDDSPPARRRQPPKESEDNKVIEQILGRLVRLENELTVLNADRKIEKLDDKLSACISEQVDALQRIDADHTGHSVDLAQKLFDTDHYAAELSERFTELDLAFKQLEEKFESSKSSRPATYGIDTPPGMRHEAPKAPDPLAENDPWSGTGRVHSGMPPSVPDFVRQSNPTLEFPRLFTAPPPQTMRSQVPQASRAMPSMPAPAQAFQASQGDDRAIYSSFGKGKSIQKDISYVVNQKYTDGLTTFTGSIRDFEPWARKMVDHLKGSTIRYESVMTMVRACTIKLTKEILTNTEIDGFNGWEISQELGRFTKKWLGSGFVGDEAFYSLCGGSEVNGFELWRKLQIQYGGGGKVVEVSGHRNFLTFPRCSSEAGLVAHLDSWEKALAEHGQHLRENAETLRILVLGILPPVIESKLTPKVLKYPDYQSIIRFCHDKQECDRQQVIADALHGRRGAKSVNALGPHQDAALPAEPPPQPSAPAVPTMADLAQMIAALGGKGAGRDTRKGAGKGDPKGRGKGGQGNKFMFRGCWECGQEGHSRHECEAWKKLLDAQGRPPSDHKGAKDKAYLAWKAKRDAKGAGKGGKGAASLKVLMSGENTEDEDDEEWDDEDYGKMWALSYPADRPPVSTSNKFDALTSSDDDHDESPLLDAMNSFAHKLVMGKKQSQREKAKAARAEPRGDSIVIESMADFNSDAARSRMPALPKNINALNRLARKRPESEEVLQEGEQWVMADTGAAVNAICVRRDCPQYLPHVQASTRRKSGAECADGTFLEDRGEAKCAVEIDGVKHVIAFKDMDVSMPIASMQRAVKCGNRLEIDDDGGSITNKLTGERIRLHERRGTYFFKCKFLSPETLPEAMRSSGFIRQG